jgi:poly(A) polymerase
MGREIIEVTTFRGDHAGDSSTLSKTSQNGRLLRDNVYGTLDQDAARRDLTINAMYLDPTNKIILDDLGGLEDVKRRIVRIIGDPATRYREDPVRMLRVVRFAAKLGFSVDSDSLRAISACQYLLNDIPAARLFDETLKLFMAGYAAPTFEHLVSHNLLSPLFPDAVNSLTDESAQPLIVKAMSNTDARIARGKPVTPAFLLGALLWPAVHCRSDEIARSGNHEGAPVQAAGQQILMNTVQHVAIPKRFSIPMKEIWDLQPRLEKCASKRVTSIISLRRFRAAFDLLLLRAEQEPTLEQAVTFWEEQQQLFPDLVGSQPATEIPTRKRRTRRRKNTP